MKLDTAIRVDFIDFIKTGRFDYLKIGQTKEHILNHFPDPKGDNPHDFYLNSFYYSKLHAL